MKISRVQITATDCSARKLQITVRPTNEVRTVTIGLDQCALDVQKRSCSKQKVKKAIFKPITATFEPGVLNVIMGPSGSGKTSLLKFMARRLKGALGTTYCSSGRMLFNGSVASESIIRSICSYVPQDDDGLLPSLTVRETLRFAALLRLPSRMSKTENVRRAESVLLKLSLKDCADTIIGSEYIKGISGGERRRVTIAIQILTDPRILFLDEPTSGLDAFTSSTIIDVLEGLAEEGRTIIFTIHQSRSDLFKRFGSVLLLASSGDIAYSGPTSKMLPYFESLGFACAETTNPADFVLDLITSDMHNAGAFIFSRAAVTLQACVQDESQVLALGMLGRKRSSFYTALPILIHRGITNLRRQPNLVSGRISQLLGLGIIVTAFWAPIGNDYYSVQSRTGHILQISSSYFVGMLNSIAMFPYERAIFYKEDDDNTYPLEAFFLYFLALEIPMELIASILFSLLTVIACGLPRTPSLFFLMAYNAFCVVSCGESLGIIFLTIFSHTGVAVSIMSVVLAISMHLSGILSLSVPSFLQALNYASPVKWQVGSLASYSLHSINFTCTDFQQLPDGHCPIEDGNQVLALYGLDINTRTYTIALSIVTVSYRILAYLVLKVRRIYWKDFFKKNNLII